MTESLASRCDYILRRTRLSTGRLKTWVVSGKLPRIRYATPRIERVPVPKQPAYPQRTRARSERR